MHLKTKNFVLKITWVDCILPGEALMPVQEATLLTKSHQVIEIGLFQGDCHQVIEVSLVTSSINIVHW